MAKYVNPLALTGGLDWIDANVDKIVIVKSYVAGDSYATVTGGTNIIAEVTGGDVVLTISDGATTNSKKIVSSAKSNAAIVNAYSGGGDTHAVWLKTTATAAVVYATDETSEQTFTVTDLMNIPTITLTYAQPA